MQCLSQINEEKEEKKISVKNKNSLIHQNDQAFLGDLGFSSPKEIEGSIESV